MDVQIRRSDGSTADYDTVQRLSETAQSDYPVSVEELRSRDTSRRAAGLVAERLIAETDGRAVGHLGYGHLVSAADGDVFSVGLDVDPNEWGKGIGRALHEAMLAAAAQAEVTRVLAFVDERQRRGMEFSTAAGYREVGRAWESTINPQGFEVGPLQPIVDRVRSDGLALIPLADLKAASPNWIDRLYHLYDDLEKDMPFPIEERPSPFTVFRSEVIDSDLAIPEAFFIALEGDEWVGLTEFRRVKSEPNWLTQELTGVVRSHRRRGIATALKVVGLQWARTHGFRRVRTFNDSRNTGMLAVNAKLGLTRGHALVGFLLHLDG